MKYRGVWLTSAWLLLAVVWYLSLTGKPPDVDFGFYSQDKLKHAFAYASLSLSFCQLYLTSMSRRWVLGLLVLNGVGIELLQGMSGQRMFEYADMLANTVGVGLGYVLVRTRLGRLFITLEMIYEKNGYRK